MREIKFRAWDKDKKEMFEVGALTFNDEKLGIAVDDEDWKIRPHSEPMQFTGLKDKNGKEIFEGDILSILWIEEDQYEVGDVQWWDAGFRFVTDCEAHDPFHISDLWVDDKVLQIEIIGNIYENPELLEEK